MIKLYRTRKGTMVHFDNSGKYGIDFKEVQIVYNPMYSSNKFYAILSDGYKFLNVGKAFNTLKEAVEYGKQELA